MEPQDQHVELAGPWINQATEHPGHGLGTKPQPLSAALLAGKPIAYHRREHPQHTLVSQASCGPSRGQVAKVTDVI